MNKVVTRVDHEDPRCRAAIEAERQFFGHFGLDYREHFLRLAEPELHIRVLEVGEGEPILMVPGGSGEAVFFAPLIAELTGRRIIAMNRPGGGLSDGVDHGQVDVHRLAVDSIKLVADAFDLEAVPVIANSMGGLWSFWYALEFPNRIARMVQIGCPALILNTSAPFMMRLLGVPILNNVIAPQMQPQRVDGALNGLRFQGSYQEDIDRMPRVGAEAAYHFFQLPTYLDTWKTLVASVATLGGAKPQYNLGADQLQRVEMPVLFVWGDNDPFGGLEVARRATRLMPDARLHEMHAGHLPHLDKPEETGQVVRNFLSESGAAILPPKLTQPIGA